jgi:hypothetical protein
VTEDSLTAQKQGQTPGQRPRLEQVQQTKQEQGPEQESQRTDFRLQPVL